MAEFTVNVKGIGYPVTVDGNGLFYATNGNGGRCKADTLAKLKQRLALASAKVSVPYTHYKATWNGKPEFIDGEFTGIHADGRRLLAREDGKAEQYGTHQLGGILQRLTPDEREELIGLSTAKLKADDDLNHFIELHRLHRPFERIASAARGTQDGEGDG